MSDRLGMDDNTRWLGLSNARGAIVAPCWWVVWLRRLRTRGQPVFFQREILLLTFVLYLSGLAVATLTPNRSSRYRAEATTGMQLHPDLASLTCSSAILPGGSTAPTFCLRNARGNVMLFLPLGSLLPLVWRRLCFRSALLIALALSCSIEIVQYLSRSWGINRTSDVNDVILNVFGASLGLVLASLLRLGWSTRPAVPRT